MKRLFAAILLAGVSVVPCAAQRRMHSSHPYHPPAPPREQQQRRSAPKAAPTRVAVSMPAAQQPSRRK